jgi:hypothetical protein
MQVLMAMGLEEEPETRTGTIVVILTVCPTSSCGKDENALHLLKRRKRAAFG